MIADDPINGPETVEFSVPLSDIVAYCNPLDGQEWDCAPIEPAAVIDAANHQEFETEHWQEVNKRHRGQAFDDFTFHIRRMAFLYANADSSSIELELDRFERKMRLRVFDGNHRLGSAIIRDDAEIGVTVPLDDVEDFLAIVPSAVPTAQKVNAPTAVAP
ncbi:hypothetical protein [Rhizobium sp. BK176]|uniref:hypothetical protein n=1 Tax=Rhizobium sp. BK176 TaxID=2587071 RepID=UPI0021688D6E|nr:hypothetical protein [Rhizobium sp. BK176]MCS4089207.1 hypothetical protein [Rhizobium sp. BK176]